MVEKADGGNEGLRTERGMKGGRTDTNYIWRMRGGGKKTRQLPYMSEGGGGGRTSIMQ